MLDTNAVSETEKPRPNLGFIAWHDSQDPAHLFITTLTLVEGWHGFHCLNPNHPDYVRIKKFALELPRKYRVLNFDARGSSGTLDGYFTKVIWEGIQVTQASDGGPDFGVRSVQLIN